MLLPQLFVSSTPCVNSVVIVLSNNMGTLSREATMLFWFLHFFFRRSTLTGQDLLP